MLPRRALAVVIARDDEAAPRFLRAFRERRVDVFEHVLRDRGDVRPQGEELRPRGHDVVRRDVVAEADQHLALDRVFWRRGDRKWRDVRPADDLDGSAVSRGPLVSTRSAVCPDPGDTAIEIPEATCFPSRACATMLRSRKDEFTLLPTATWATSVPATSRTGFTLSGLDGQAMSGSSLPRSTSTVSS